MEKSTKENITQNNLQEPNAFTIVSVEPGAYQENQIAWTTTDMASSASLTLQTVSGLEQYQLPQRVVIETLIPFNQDNADSSLPELVDNKTIETDGNAIDPASGEDASIKSFDEKLDAAELNKEEVFSDLTGMLSASVIDAIPENNPTFLDNLQTNYNVAVNMTTNGASVSGSFSALTHLEKALRHLLFSSYPLNQSKKQFQKIHKETLARPQMADKGITCNLLLPQVSFHGREVRRHPRYANYLSPFYSVFEDEQGEPTRKKRRVGRPRKKVPMKNNEKDKNTCKSEIAARDLENPTDIDTLTDLPMDSSLISEQKLEKFNSDFSTDQQREDNQNNEEKGITDKNYFPTGSDFTGLNGRRIPKKDYEALAPFKFFCKECSFKSKRESHFAKHIKLHETSSNLFQCKRCDFTSIRLSHLRRHEVLHSQTLLCCQQCKYNTDSSKLLARHVKNKHSTQQKQHTMIYTCSKCQYKTLRRHLYNSHLQISHNQTMDADTIGSNGSKQNKTYQCDLCAYKTQRKEHYVRHQNNVHCNRRPYLCDLCGKAFKRPDALAQHKYTHMDKSARVLPFTCTLCAKAFRSQAHLNEHMTMHSSIRSHLCHFCGASFKTRSVQQKHIQTIHVNPRSYNCTQCDKRFNTNYALRRHKHTHNTPGMRCELQQMAPTESATSIQQVTVPNLTNITANCQEPQTLVQEVMAASPIDVTYDQSSDTIRQPLIQSNETTTALLYLTNNLSPY